MFDGYCTGSHDTRHDKPGILLSVIKRVCSAAPAVSLSSTLAVFLLCVVAVCVRCGSGLRTHTHTHFIHSTFTPNEGNQIVCLFGQEMSKCCVGMLAGERDRERRTKKTDAADDNQGVSGARRSVSPCLVWSGVWFPVYTVRHFTLVPPVCEQEWEECHRCCLWLVEWMGVNEWKECSVNCLEWSSGLERGCISTGHLSF